MILKPCHWNPSICLVLLKIFSQSSSSTIPYRKWIYYWRNVRKVNSIQNENLRTKNIKAHAGDARFWKAIDDSFESSEVKKVQLHVGDSEPNAFELRTSGVELEVKDGKVVDVHPKHWLSIPQWRYIYQVFIWNSFPFSEAIFRIGLSFSLRSQLFDDFWFWMKYSGRSGNILELKTCFRFP